jgi:NAD(P)-dependent dehydrogenase (short-subunit alcohol dehydrogenase family)
VSGHLHGRSVLVTGAARNLGAVLAERFATAGATVVVHSGHDQAAAASVRASLEHTTGRAHHSVVGDLADPDGPVEVAAAARSLAGSIDVLVNNAGPFSATPFTQLPLDEWRRTLDVNLTATYLLTRELAPDMRAAGWGRVVNLSAGSAAIRNHATYGLVKASVSFLTESLALELGPEVTVNALAPGQIAESGPDAEAVEPGFVERATARTPTGQLVTRAEVADLAVALTSPLFAAVSGATIPVDGGWRVPRA